MEVMVTNGVNELKTIFSLHNTDLANNGFNMCIIFSFF